MTSAINIFMQIVSVKYKKHSEKIIKNVQKVKIYYGNFRLSFW